MGDDEPPVFARLCSRLRDAGVEFRTLQHAPVYTSEQAAQVRGTTLHSGAKALIVKAGEEFVMIVLPADLALDSNALRKHLGVKRLRFADKEEVEARTGLAPGSIPPFGSLFGLVAICDDRLAENECINFNAGSHSVSIQMSYPSYVSVETPCIARVAK